MTLSDIVEDEPEVPSDPPAPEEGSPELPDQPLGPPAELPEEDAPLPGLPEREPPASE